MIRKNHRTNEELKYAAAWSPAETARMLGRSRAHIYALVNSGALKAYGRPLMLDPDEVKAAVKAGFAVPSEVAA